MDLALAEAFIHGRHTVCGFDLAPFTLRHAFILEALESPLSIIADAKVTYPSLLKAAQICSARNEAELENIHTLPTNAPLTDAPITAPLTTDQAEAEYAAWNRYLTDHITAPRLLESPGGGSYQNHPLLVIAAKLIQNGFSPDQAWWTPYGAARWYSLAFDDLNPLASFKLRTEQLEEKLRTLGHEV